jgi:hypothetical protein
LDWYVVKASVVEVAQLESFKETAAALPHAPEVSPHTFNVRVTFWQDTAPKFHVMVPADRVPPVLIATTLTPVGTTSVMVVAAEELPTLS